MQNNRQYRDNAVNGCLELKGFEMPAWPQRGVYEARHTLEYVVDLQERMMAHRAEFESEMQAKVAACISLRRDSTEHLRSITVQGMGNTCKLTMSSDDTVAYLKAMIQHELGIPFECQLLIKQGRVLEEDATLEESGIYYGGHNTVHVVQTQPGAEARRLLEVPGEISVQMVDGKKLTLQVEGTCTIKALKTMIHAAEGIAVKEQQLRKRKGDNAALEDAATLQASRIFHNSIVYLTSAPVNKIVINVKTFVATTDEGIDAPAKTITLSGEHAVSRQDTIAVVKAKIQAKEGIDSDQQALSFSFGKPLADGCTLKDLKIEDQSVLLMSLPGEMRVNVKLPTDSDCFFKAC